MTIRAVEIEAKFYKYYRRSITEALNFAARALTASMPTPTTSSHRWL
jgi:hypothetical protein